MTTSSIVQHRWGICATGRISNDFVSCLLHLQKAGSSLEVVAVAAGSGISSAERFAERFGIKSAYGSYEELFKDPEVGQFSEPRRITSQTYYRETQFLRITVITDCTSVVFLRT